MSAGQPSSLDLDALDLNPKALEGRTVVITGTLPNLSRKQAQELVERAGGKVTGSISSKTNLLIAGDKAGSKLKKAEELGVEVLDEDGLLKHISNQAKYSASNIDSPRRDKEIPFVQDNADRSFGIRFSNLLHANNEEDTKEETRVINSVFREAITSGQIQSWAYIGRTLYEKIYHEHDFQGLGHSSLAELCGYYYESKDDKVIQNVLFKEALDDATEEYDEWLRELKLLNSNDDSDYFIINNRLCCKDIHSGNVYVPQRCIISDAAFYRIDEWEKVTREYLIEEECIEDVDLSTYLKECVELIYEEQGYSEKDLDKPDQWLSEYIQCLKHQYIEIREQIKEIDYFLDGFDEVMMVKRLTCMMYADNNEFEMVDDKDLLKWARIKQEDIHPISSWHDC